MCGMSHSTVARIGAFTFATALTLSAAACDQETIQPSEENPASDPPDDDEEAEG